MSEMPQFTPNFDQPDAEETGQDEGYTPRSQASAPVKQSPFSVFGSIQTIMVYAFLLASLFTLFTPNNLFSGQTLQRMFQAWQANPTLVAQPILQPVQSTSRIGIVSGHWNNDSGSVCADGLKEADVNLAIASLVQQKLTQEGFQVDLLEEFDSRLSQYQAIALVSIHSDTCEYLTDQATGFKVAAALETAYPENTSRLEACLVDRYGTTTGLPYRLGNTNDMTYYHAFNEVNAGTPAVIIEVGYLNLDRQILTSQQSLIADGIVNGLLCYIRNESISPTVAP
jgi:N-acetylmuramoyl-L-alanine amidase